MDSQAWCPLCERVTPTKSKPYILSGLKRRDDFFCQICNHQVIPNARDDSYYKKHKRFEWIERTGFNDFIRQPEVIFLVSAFIACAFFTILN